MLWPEGFEKVELLPLEYVKTDVEAAQASWVLLFASEVS